MGLDLAVLDIYLGHSESRLYNLHELYNGTDEQILLFIFECFTFGHLKKILTILNAKYRYPHTTKSNPM